MITLLKNLFVTCYDCDMHFGERLKQHSFVFFLVIVPLCLCLVFLVVDSIQEASFSSLYQLKIYKFSLVITLIFYFVIISVLSLSILSPISQIILFLGLSLLQLLLRYISFDNEWIIFISWLILSITLFNTFKCSVWIKLGILIFEFLLLELTEMPLNYFAVDVISENNPYCLKIVILSISLTIGSFISFYNNKLDLSIETENKLDYEKKINKQLSEFNKNLQSYVRDYGYEAAEIERKRITREMHDANGYHFTNIIALMNAAMSCANKDYAVIDDLLHTTLQQAQEGLCDSRKILHKIRDSFNTIHTNSIYNEIFQVSRIFQECTGIDISIEWGNLSNNYDNTQVIALSRIIQECLVNSIKHGHASCVKISFWEINDVLSFVVEDNGQGSKSIVKGIGLTGMEERLIPFGGRLKYGNMQVGFAIVIEVPIKRKNV